MEEIKIKKIDTNNFQVSETVTRNVDKKSLKASIEEIEKTIKDKKDKSGITSLEKELADKKELLSSLK